VHDQQEARLKAMRLTTTGRRSGRDRMVIIGYLETGTTS
jgi:hypothetical protein